MKITEVDINEALDLALLGLRTYQKFRDAGEADGVSPDVLAAADARFANIVADPLGHGPSD